jgi:hypothetical protein
MFNITVPASVRSEIAFIRLFDETGKLRLETEVFVSEAGIARIDLSNLPPKTYMYSLVSPYRNLSGKIIKQ